MDKANQCNVAVETIQKRAHRVGCRRWGGSRWHPQLLSTASTIEMKNASSLWYYYAIDVQDWASNTFLCLYLWHLFIFGNPTISRKHELKLAGWLYNKNFVFIASTLLRFPFLAGVLSYRLHCVYERDCFPSDQIWVVLQFCWDTNNS